MKYLFRRWLPRLAPPLPIRDPLDHPDIRRMTRQELDDLPMPHDRAATLCAEQGASGSAGVAPK